jgi:hypothetical protein
MDHVGNHGFVILSTICRHSTHHYFCRRRIPLNQKGEFLQRDFLCQRGFSAEVFSAASRGRRLRKLGTKTNLAENVPTGMMEYRP